MAEKKDVKRYKCMNFGACQKADQGTIIEINALETIGGTPECPYCHQHTLEEQVEKPTNWKLIGGIAAAVVVLGGGAAFMFTGGGEKPKVEEDKVVIDSDSIKKPVPEKISVKQLSIVGGDITLKEGGNQQLSMTVEPEKHDEVISWSSDNEAVATVDNTGVVTAVRQGTTNIKITADGSGVSASIKVTVKRDSGSGGSGGGGSRVGETTGQGTKVFSYGKYIGSLKNGLPDGTGKLTFTRSYQLNSEHTAQAGEYIQGIFENGKPTFVTYYKNDGTVTKIKLR